MFRRLAASNGADPAPKGDKPTLSPGAPTVLRRVDTRPVGFAVFDRVLLSVHPEDAAVRDAFCSKLLSAALPDDIGRVAVPALDVRSVSARILQARQT